MANVKVKDVIKIGLNLVGVESTTESNNLFPCALFVLILSMIKIEFLTTKPINKISPIIEKIFRV